MAHNRRFFRSVVVAPIMVPSPALLAELDQVASESVNWDDGGAWTPATPIVIGGAGVTIASAGGFTGGLSTGARAPAGALILGDDDWPQHAARTRTVLFPINDRVNAHYEANNGAPSPEYDQATPGAVIGGVGGALAIALGFGLDSRKFPIGATIASVVLRFSVRTKPAAVPGSLPTVVLNDDQGTSDTQALPAPGTTDLYFNDGRPQSLTLTPVNNAIVVAGSTYLVTINDDSQTGNTYHSIAVTFSNILSMRPAL